MTKRAFLIHGWQGYPEEGWRPWLKNELTKRGFEVFIPAMPDTNHPKMDAWVNHLKKIVGKPDENCLFIGYSLGCIAILRYLETLGDIQRIAGAIFVAGFTDDLEYPGYKGELSSFFKSKMSWQKLKKICQKFFAIHSDNDPWVPLKHGNILKEKLGAELIVMYDMKHFSGDDGIFKLPIVLELIVKITEKPKV